MNIDREVCWGARALGVLDRVRRGELTARQRARLPREMMEQKFGWLDEYREAIAMWMEVASLGKVASSVVRREGYGATTVAALRAALRPPKHPESQRFVAQLVEHVTPMCEASRRYGKLPGSSEVLESLIGKGKRLLGTSNNGNSLTRQVLALVTSTAKITPELVRTALSTCRIKHLNDWCRNHLRPGVHRNRREDLHPTPEEINLRKHNIAASPIF